MTRLKKQIELVLFFSRGNGGSFILALSLMGIAVFLQFSTPFVTMLVVNKVVYHPASVDQIGPLCLVLLALLLASVGARMKQRALFSTLRLKLVNRIRRTLFRHGVRLPLQRIEDSSLGYLMVRIRDDPDEIQSLMAETIVILMSDAITITIGIAFLLHLQPRLALATCSILPLLCVGYANLKTSLAGDLRAAHAAAGKVNSLLADTLSNVFSIKALGCERTMARQFTAASTGALRRQLSVTHKRLRYETSLSVLVGVVPVFVLWYCGFEIAHRRLTIGEFIAFNAYLAYLYKPAENLTLSLLGFQGAVVALERVGEFLEWVPERNSGVKDLDPIPGPRGGGAIPICFQKVDFSYGKGAPLVLEQVSFNLKEGQFTGLFGASGVGKSTIVKLTGRFMSPVSGRILLYGEPLDSLELVTIRRRIAVVSAEMKLFHGSVRENLLLGARKADSDTLRRAAKAAAISDYIESLPAGYETQLSDAATNLSLGQRQRLLIARALLRNPEVMVLDEATSGLDLDTESSVLGGIQQWSSVRSGLVISHRLEAMRTFARLLRLEHSRVLITNEDSFTATTETDLSHRSLSNCMTGERITSD